MIDDDPILPNGPNPDSLDQRITRIESQIEQMGAAHRLLADFVDQLATGLDQAASQTSLALLVTTYHRHTHRIRFDGVATTPPLGTETPG